MAVGYFKISQDGNNLDIVYQVADANAGDCPDDQLALKNDLEAAEAALKVLYPVDEQRLPRFRELLSLAKVGLEGNAQPKVAVSALANLKQSILMIEGGIRKNRYFKELGVLSAGFALPAFALAAVLKCWLPRFLPVLGSDLHAFLPFVIALSLLFGGAMIGAWLSYGLRTVTLTFDELTMPEEDRLEPRVRLVFVGVLTLVVGLALYLGVIEVSLGKISSQDLVHRNALALLVGVLLGASERALTEQVTKLVGNLLPK
jgi:hypothetical protein